MPFKQPTTTYEEARQASRAVRGLPVRTEMPATPAPAAPTPDVAPETAAPIAATPAEAPAPTVEPPPAPRAARAAPPRPRVAAQAAPAAAARPVPRDAGRKVMLSLSVPFPAPGVSPSFDAIAAHHDGNTAMKALLKRALPAFEERMRAGDMGDPAADYQTGEGNTDTTRMVDAALVDAARAHFDPFGVLSLRALARRIACAALASWFAQEKRG